ncbi:hypothetical protein KCG44_07310 [Pacificimonas sp. WHA3]|uniref:Secreted protein n=1 Tax=Pacificimonas pallii TaxID=2827236 RepID=A0ABS6SFG0_9SPHN|nr:hypothetical protein [Pacificimonas pallii]MBV7256592.1 hypothetical protein [Pacificimonas pallii]
MRFDRAAHILATLALPAAMLSPAPPAEANMLRLPLCSGGSLEIPFDGEDTPPAPSPACHAACLREREPKSAVRKSVVRRAAA